jgi:hypothetical protein
MTPEEKRRRGAKASARAEKIKADVMRAVAILITDAWTPDELREHVVRRLLADQADHAGRRHRYSRLTAIAGPPAPGPA